MEDLVPLLLFGGLAAFGAFALARILGDERRRRRVTTRRIQRGPSGAVTAIGGRERPIQRFRGAGPDATRPFRLEQRAYWLRYRLPPNVLTSVSLVRLADGDSVPLLVTSGSGQLAVDVEIAGDYLLRVEPADGRAVWSLAVEG